MTGAWGGEAARVPLVRHGESRGRFILNVEPVGCGDDRDLQSNART